MIDSRYKRDKPNGDTCIQAPLMSLCEDISTAASCVCLAKALLGKALCRKVSEGVMKGVIVETEAYIGPHDRAAHSFGGKRTLRNEAMYMGMGTCYVYIIYGTHHCFNISSSEEGAAVLIRAIEPFEGIDLMLRHREVKGHKITKMRDIANGPSKLCKAMAISCDMNKMDLMNNDKIWLERRREVKENEIIATKRIGIRSAGEWEDMHLRFYIEDSLFVSFKKKQ